MTVEAARAGDLRMDVGALLGAVWGRAIRILIVTALILALTFVYLMFQPKLYESSSSLLVEDRSSSYTQAAGASASSGPSVSADAMISSQIELIRSRDTLLAVIAELKLADIAEFSGSSGGLLGVFGKSGPSKNVDEAVLQTLNERLTVIRERDSAVISIFVRSQDPQLAAQIANTIAAEHVRRRAAQSLDDTAEATAWLSAQIDALRLKVQDADTKVADYKVANDIFAGPNNTSLSDQALRYPKADHRCAGAAQHGPAARCPHPGAAESRPAARQRARRARQPGDPAIHADPRHSAGRTRPKVIDPARQPPDDPRSERADCADRRPDCGAGQAHRHRPRGPGEHRDRHHRLAQRRPHPRQDRRVQPDQGQRRPRQLEREAKAQRDLLDSYLLRYRDAASRTDAGSALPDVRVITQAAPSVVPASPKSALTLAAVGFAALALQIGAVLFGELMSGRAVYDRASSRNAREPDLDEEEPVFDDDVPVELAPLPVIVPELVTPSMPVAPRPAAPAPVMAPVEPPPAPRHTANANAALGLSNLSADIAIGRVRIVLIAAVGQARDSAIVADMLTDDALRRGLSVCRIDAGSGRPSASPGLTDLCAEQASFGDVVHKMREGLAEVPWGHLPALERRSLKPVTLVEALADIYEVVVISAGRAGLGSNLPVFAGVNGKVVLVTPAGVPASAAEAVAADAAVMGFDNALTLAVPEPQHAVA